jgi:hypothetical protein
MIRPQKTRDRLRFFLFPLILLLPLAALAASPFAGRWRLDPAHSSALDGWSACDLVISLDGSRIALRHDLRLRDTKVTATNVVDTAHPTAAWDFFRIGQRHVAAYPAQAAKTRLHAAWLDAGRTLRVEAETPLEVSQGRAIMRIYSEYRLLEGDGVLELIELHSSRPRPLVYRFTKIAEEK